MKMGTEPSIRFHALEEPWRNFSGIQGSQAQTRNIRLIQNRSHESGEIQIAVLVIRGVDRRQDDFIYSPGDEQINFLQDLFHRHAATPAAGERNNTVTTKSIAAVLDL